jgi:hypothetical protein
MYFAAALLFILAGMFYAAGNHEMGNLGLNMCSYGGAFCENPIYVFVAALIAGLWGRLVSIR